MPYSAQQIHRQEVGMSAAAAEKFGRQWDNLETKEILFHALASARRFDDTEDPGHLRRKVRREVRRRMGLSITGLLWWVVPRLVAWLVFWWLENRDK